MKLTRLLSLAAVPLVMLACAPADDDVDVLEDDAAFEEPMVMEEPGAMMDMDMQTMDFMALGDMGHTGQVQVMPMGMQTQIMVTLSGPEAGAHMGHIHQGTCDNLGSVVVPLETVDVMDGAPGTSTSTVDIPAETVMNGQHVVAYHVAGGEPGQPVVCANIPMHAM